MKKHSREQPSLTNLPQPAGLRNTPRPEESSQGFSTLVITLSLPSSFTIQLQFHLIHFKSKYSCSTWWAWFSILEVFFCGGETRCMSWYPCFLGLLHRSILSYSLDLFLPYYISSNIILVDPFVQLVFLRLAADRIPMTVSWVNAWIFDIHTFSG